MSSQSLRERLASLLVCTWDDWPLLSALCSLNAQILSEDTRLRAACMDASQGPLRGGAEERLHIEVSDLLAQKTTMESEVTSAELRVQRYVPYD